MKRILINIVLMISGPVFGGGLKFDLNDVSYLLPVPEALPEDKLLDLQKNIPAEFLHKFPRLHMRYRQDAILKQMQSVSIRLDPLERHIRVVWQPVIYGVEEKTTTLDVALHSFHKLDEPALNKLVQNLREWKLRNSDIKNVGDNFRSLQVHPLVRYAFKSDSPEQERHEIALRELLGIFQNSLRRASVVKVTAMVLRGADDMWAFLGFELDSNKTPQAIVVPRTGNHLAQTYVNTAVPFNYFERSEISGVVDIGFNLREFLTEVQMQKQLSEVQVREALEISHELENPRLFPESKMDCVHCHIVQSVREYLGDQYSEAFAFKSQYSNSKYILTNTSEMVFNTRQIRGFGYFGRGSAISQRVVHDSAEAADYLNKLYPNGGSK